MNTHLVPRSRLLQLFLPAVLCLVLALSAAVSAADCGSFKTCDACTNESSALNCSWVKCDDGLSCVNSNFQSANCSIVNCTEANTTVSTPTTVPSSPDCGSFKTCDACTNESSALNCSWVKCDDGLSCVNSNFQSANCSIVNCTEANTTVSTPTTVPSSHSTTTAVVPTALPKKGTFDAASFIGGVVLVLGVQAVVFFVYKFCKAKERNYHTL